MKSKELILVAPKLGIGGIQRAVSNLANWLSQTGHQVSLVSCKKEDLFYDLDQNVKVYVPNFEYQRRRIFLPIYYFKVIFYLRGVFKKSNSKIVFSFGESFNPLSILASLGLSKIVYVSDRTSPDFKFPRYVKWLKKQTYPLAEGLICQTSRSKKWNDNYFKGRVSTYVVPNMVEMRSNSPSPKENWILYIGRLSWEKGPERLLEAFAQMKNSGGYKLIICGSGPLNQSLREKSNELALNSQVEFKGQVKDVDFYYSKARVFVLPSHLEGFPNAMCEAMASGLPAICYESIPYEELGVPGVDFLVASDLNDLVVKLDKLTEDEDLQYNLGVNAKKSMAKLSMDTIGQAYFNLYQKHS